MAALAVKRRSIFPNVVGRMRKETGVPSWAGIRTDFLRNIDSSVNYKKMQLVSDFMELNKVSYLKFRYLPLRCR